MSKRIWVVIPGTGDEAEGREVEIEKNTTAADLLHALELDPAEYGLQRQQEDEFAALSSAEAVYAQVKEGDKLHVVPTQMVVGALPA